MEDGVGEVTQLLQAMRSGDAEASARVLPLVYTELHRLAKAYMRQERPGHTLQPTALIHEAYLRLAKDAIECNDRQHFIAVAAHVMRRVLVDYARTHKAGKRGGALRRVELTDDLAISQERLDQVLMMDEALGRLAAKSSRQAQVVELRYFGGLSVEQIAEFLGMSPRSVKRDWALARIWLFQELGPVNDGPSAP